MVACSPEYRREGHVREMMLKMLADMQAEDYAVSCLYPFKDTFYMALGYVKMPPTGGLEFEPGQLRSKAYPEGYSVRRVEGSEGHKAWAVIHESAVERIHGAVRRSEKRWTELTKDSKAKIAVAYGPDNKPAGVMVYGIKGFGEGHDWAETGRIKVLEIFWSNYTARDALLAFLFMHSDQIVKATLPGSPVYDDYYHWIEEIHSPSMTTRILPMSRIVSVERVLSGLNVKQNGAATIEVHDPLLKSNSGSYAISASDGKLDVSRTKKKADVSMTTEGLTALLYGTLSPEQAQNLGWISGRVPQVLTDWLPRATPWLTEDF
jgi:predicted acetyltransferase